jgi:MFS transporter, DHA1 family, tetracycline resistance protein
MNKLQSSNPKRAIFLTIALDLIGLTIIFPILPSFIDRFWISHMMVGVIGATYAFFSFVSAPYLGRLSDKFWRRNILLASVMGSAVGWIITAFAPNVWWVIIGRVIDGITAGNITIAQAILSDISKDSKERAKYYGVFGMMFGMAMVVWPLLGWFLIRFGFPVPFLVSGIFSIINAILIWWTLPETNIHRGQIQEKMDKFAVFNALFHDKIAMYLWLFFVVGLGAGVYRHSYGLYMDGFYHLDETHIGYILASVGLFMAFCQWYLLNYFWLKKFTPRQILFISLCAASILFTFVAFYDQTPMPNIRIWLIAELCMVFFTIAMWPVIQSEGMQHADPKKRGEITGYFSSLGSLTAIIGPLVGAWMIGQHISPIWSAALGSIIGLVWILIYRKRF